MAISMSGSQSAMYLLTSGSFMESAHGYEIDFAPGLGGLSIKCFLRDLR